MVAQESARGAEGLRGGHGGGALGTVGGHESAGRVGIDVARQRAAISGADPG
ncbi:conserved hypothetical protein [Burkholderiales bacterium]|nr:conserved hypothetical protein [Burkholderiales bacterium]